MMTVNENYNVNNYHSMSSINLFTLILVLFVCICFIQLAKQKFFVEAHGVTLWYSKPIGDQSQ